MHPRVLDLRPELVTEGGVVPEEPGDLRVEGQVEGAELCHPVLVEVRELGDDAAAGPLPAGRDLHVDDAVELTTDVAWVRWAERLGR